MPLSAPQIVELHDLALERWHDAVAAGYPGAVSPPPPPDSNDTTLRELFEAAHFANFTIWGLEDEARRRDLGDARIAAVKRAIDPWNQRRNDLMEAIDAAVLERFANADTSKAELHSETVGMMIDRLSVLALKLDNMQRVAAEAAAAGDELLAARCTHNTRVLREQREDLAGCLARLLEDFAAGRRYFKKHLQLKSYNDERLNPALRAEARNAGRK